jgi:hypothetical protein
MTKLFSPRIDSHFELSDLVSEIGDKKVLQATASKKPRYKINFSVLEKGGRRYRINILGKTRLIRSDDEIIGKIPHECVCNLLDGTSDMKLWKLGLKGPETNLSPDYVDTNHKLFIEVATSRSPEERVLNDRFEEKIIHYKSVANHNSYQVGVIVVSTDSVMTNLTLSTQTVNALCHRFRAGLAIHSSLEKIEGRSLVSENDNPKLRIVRSVVADLSRRHISDLKTSKDFPVEKILSFQKPPTQSEMKKTARLLRKCRLEAQEVTPGKPSDLQDYIDSYGTNCRTDKKRVCNIPMVIPRDNSTEGFDYDLDLDTSNLPDFLKEIWKSSQEVAEVMVDRDIEQKEALGKQDFEQHRIQRSQCFNCRMSDDLKEEASTTGLWGKSMKMTEAYKLKKETSKLSFHPVNTPVDDIEEFVSRENLKQLDSNWFQSIPSDMLRLMADAKKLWTDDEPLSLTLLEKFSKTELVSHASMLSGLFTEICYCYKYWIKRADFYKKWWGKVQMVVRCVGDHTFVSFAFPKKDFKSWDTGRIGPSLFESRNYIFTDVCSYNEPTIEHFVKSGPYMGSILIHLQSNLDTPLDKVSEFSNHVSKTMSGIYLLYLNNKTDSEELMTNQRYLNMGVLEDLQPNPFKFVKRLPEMYKSRLTCYLFKRTCQEITRFSERTPKKVPVEESGVTTLEYDWLRGIFSNEPLTFRQKLNEFYFGYVISKERGRGADRNFKIMKKIVEQEYKYRDDSHPLFTDEMSVKDNQTHSSMLKTLLFFYKKHLEERYGDSWRDVMETNLIEKLAGISFLEIATLKVSSRSYEHQFQVPALKMGMTTAEIKEALIASNPEDVKSRPKVMESLSNCIKEYLKDTKRSDVDHIIQLVPWALSCIENKGYFYSDIFPKPQHGGDREIHVLQFKARLIQMYIERISRTLCDMTPSDSLTHPNLKETFVRTHYSLAESELPSERLTLGKSADASKWCQRHHASKFAAALSGILPSIFIIGVLRILWFWTCKIIVFPLQFVANFLSNKNVESNPTYKRMQKEFETGTGIFPEPKQNRMMIKSGMMQGILHYLSSLFHAILQVAMLTIQKMYLSRKKVSSVITIIQGSDDSGELITLSGKKPSTLLKLGTIMLHWKERASRYVSIYPSYEKSCIGSSDLIEYNSEWSIRKTTYKPTFRWVSACLEVGIVEKFIDRISNFYNTATTVLEGGGSVFETSVIQLCQSWMHYLMLGVGSHPLSSKVTDLMMQSKDPSLGYFPVDSDYSAGMPGINFLLYMLFKRTSYGFGISRGKLPEVDLDMYEEDVKDATISRDLRKVQLKFGNHRIFQKIVKGMDIPTMEALLKAAELDPELIYYPEGNWNKSQTRIYMKVFEPGVKESLSKHSATARILSASAYIMSRPCLTIHTATGVEKVSLLKALVDNYVKSITGTKLPAEDVFIHSKEYEDLLKTLEEFNSSLSVQNVKLRSRNKHHITIIERETFDVSIVELCKQVWFPDRGGRTGLSSSQISRKWQQVKEMYPFLKDSRSETEKGLKMSAVQLRSFLDSLNERPRKITLLDSAAKGGSLRSVLSRVFWPSTKLHLKDELEDYATVASVRSELFSICSHWMPHSAKLLSITNLLSNIEIFKKEVPFRLKKLKIMKSAIEGARKSDLIRDILRDKLGSVGFFTVAQTGWGWNRKGYGEWKGKILDSSCVVEFQDSICSKITVDRVSNTSELGFNLLDFVESTCSDFPGTFQEADHWLSSNGRINGGRGRMKAIPLVVDPELKIQIFDELEDKEWIIETSNNLIRLKAVFPRGQLITILSDRFLSYEWDPAYKVDEDKEYSKWNNSEPMNVAEIQHELSRILNGSKAQTLKEIRNIGKARSPSGWHVEKLVDCIRRFYSITASDKDEQSPKQPELPTLNPEEREWVDNMISGDLDFDWDAIEDFSVEDQSESDFDFNVDADDVDFEDTIRLLMEEREPEQHRDNRIMPATNRCFSNLDVLSKAYTNGITLRQNILDFKQNPSYTMPGILGKIMSLILKEDRMMRGVSEEDQDVFEVEEESISLMTSIRTDTKAAALSEMGLRDSINQINNLLQSATGFPRDSLLESRSRLERLLYLRTHPTQAKAIGEYSTNQFLLRCKPLISKMSSKLRMICEMDTEFFFPLIQSELDKLVISLSDSASIAPQEASVYRESITKPNLTTLLVDLMSELTKTPMVIGEYSTAGDDTVRVDLDL